MNTATMARLRRLRSFGSLPARVMQALFATTIFFGAALLFAVQPMFARMVLPLLGGSPAVWNTSLVFYQAVLLAGYAYAHVTTRFGARRQALVHVALLVLPLLVLPIHIPVGWTPPTQSNPIPWLLKLMVVAVGLPFFVMSAASPLLQKWFAATGHRFAADPYFLYAASNAGSMIGLLSYPTLVEPFLRQRQQTQIWALGYAVMMCLVIACAAAMWWCSSRRPGGSGKNETPADAAGTAAPTTITWTRRVRWVLLAFVPSSLMLSVTTYLTTDLAAVPLLWVIPLSIYLLTFILVFARKPLVPHAWMVRALPFAVLPLTVLFGARATQPIMLLMACHLAALFVAGMMCHGELAKDRPPHQQLTEFYLWISVGGVLGGVFNALIAPLIFSSVVEYPLTVVLACLLGPRPAPAQNEQRQHWLDIGLPVVLGLLIALAVQMVSASGRASTDMIMRCGTGVAAVLCFSFRRRPLRFGLGVGAILLATASWPGEQKLLLHAERTFFGIHRVNLEDEYHRLLHGSTLHGYQSLDPARRREPLAYYVRSGPIGQVFTALNKPHSERGVLMARRNIAVVGLGAGTLAAYAAPGQRWTIYEIDPAVVRIASNTNLFTYLADSRVPVNFVLGDARLSLAESKEKYDLIILDAYSSDVIPVHLITHEAIRLYLDRLSPRGILAFHITNRHLALEPVLAGLADDAGLYCLIQDEKTTGQKVRLPGEWPSTWVVMARDRADFEGIAADPRWTRATPLPAAGAWSDDFHSIFRVFKWR